MAGQGAFRYRTAPTRYALVLAQLLLAVLALILIRTWRHGPPFGRWMARRRVAAIPASTVIDLTADPPAGAPVAQRRAPPGRRPSRSSSRRTGRRDRAPASLRRRRRGDGGACWSPIAPTRSRSRRPPTGSARCRRAPRRCSRGTCCRPAGSAPGGPTVEGRTTSVTMFNTTDDPREVTISAVTDGGAAGVDAADPPAAQPCRREPGRSGRRRAHRGDGGRVRRRRRGRADRRRADGRGHQPLCRPGLEHLVPGRRHHHLRRVVHPGALQPVPGRRRGRPVPHHHRADARASCAPGPGRAGPVGPPRRCRSGGAAGGRGLERRAWARLTAGRGAHPVRRQRVPPRLRRRSRGRPGPADVVVPGRGQGRGHRRALRGVQPGRPRRLRGAVLPARRWRQPASAGERRRGAVHLLGGRGQLPWPTCRPGPTAR